MNLLHIDSSPLRANSASRQLTAEVVAAWRQARPDLQVTYRDLAAAPPPHFSSALLAAFGDPAGASAETQADLALGETLVSEFLAADVIVIGAPMLNFSVPSTLKAWIDRVAQRGRTFKYGPNGPEGLAGGRKVVIVSSRGGVYSEGAAKALDFQEAYLRGVLAFLGIDDVTVIRAEGLNIGPEVRAKAIEAAQAQTAALFAASAAAE